MGRSPSFVKNLKKGTWTYEEDRKLVTYIEQHGHGTWREVPVKAGLRRCGKSCRLRWTNYLRPDIKRGKFSLQEEQTIIHLHALLGNRWSAIATHLPKRTDNEIKNYWNVRLKKRLTKMGIDPITHKSRTLSTNLSHMTQWEIARLEAEARLVRESRFVPNFYQRINCGPAPPVNMTTMSSLSKPLPLDVLKAWQSIAMCKLSNSSEYVTPINQNMSIMNLVDNAEPQILEDMTMEDHINSWKVSKGSLNTLESPKDEGTQNLPEVSEMTHQGNHLMEAFTNQLFNDANNDYYHDDFEHDTNYWSSILNKSAF